MFLLRQGEIDWAPAVDIYESEDSWLIFIELPGMRSQEIEITVFTERILIRGIKKPPARDLLAQKLEIYTGHFQREIVLPGRTEVDEVRASMEDGVLKIILPIKNDVSVRIPLDNNNTDR